MILIKSWANIQFEPEQKKIEKKEETLNIIKIYTDTLEVSYQFHKITVLQKSCIKS